MASFDNNSLYTFFDLSTKTVNQKIVDKYLAQDYPVRILSLFWDVCHMGSDAWTHIRPILEKASKKAKVIVLLADWLQNKHEADLSGLNVEVHYINGIGLIAYHDVVHLKKCQCNLTWKPHNRFLFLTGKWNKTNRFPLFKKLLDRGVLNDCIYSLFLPEEHEYHKYNNNPDNVNTQLVGHTPAVPFDHIVYEHTGFRLISETEYDTDLGHLYKDGLDPWLTEKTWITMMNKHPFIIAGQKSTLSKLKTMGYKTFEEYLPNKYDDADDISRLELVVDNVAYWVSHIQEQSNILQDVEHNYNHFLGRAEVDLSSIVSIIERYNLQCEVRDVIDARF
jgi:hypothetical protein